MGTEIHGMLTDEGWMYRLYQNTADVYFTEPLDEYQISEAYLKHARRQMELDHKALFRFRLKRIRESKEVRDKWDREADHSER